MYRKMNIEFEIVPIVKIFRDVKEGEGFFVRLHCLKNKFGIMKECVRCVLNEVVGLILKLTPPNILTDS